MNYSGPFLVCFYSICVLTIVRKLCRRRLENGVVTDIPHGAFLYRYPLRQSRRYFYLFTVNCIIFLIQLRTHVNRYFNFMSYFYVFLSWM